MYKKFLEEEFNNGILNESLIMDTNVLENLLNIKLSVGINKVSFIATSEKFPNLSKGLKPEITMSVIVPSDNKGYCINMPRRFLVSGRGAKKNNEYITSEFWNWLIKEKCVYDFLNVEPPAYNKDTKDISIFCDVEADGDFKSIYLNCKYLEFNSNIIEVDKSSIKESTKEQVYVYNESVYKKIEYFIYNNAVYKSLCNYKQSTYKDLYLYLYHRHFQLKSNEVIISNIGTWIKVKDLYELEPAEIMLGVNDVNSGKKELSAIVLENEVLFNCYKLNIYDDIGTSYYLKGVDGSFEFYNPKLDTSFNIKKIEGKVVFNTNINPKSNTNSSFETSYLSSGKYIVSDIEVNGEIKKFILAPVSIESLKKFYNYSGEIINLYIYKNNLYGIVGEYEQIGISAYYGFSRIELGIKIAPDNKYNTFVQTKSELFDLLNKTSKAYDKVEFLPYDKRFMNKSTNLSNGDDVVIVAEPEIDSEIKGLKAKLVKIYPNTRLVKIRLFNYIDLELPINCIEKA